MKAVEVIDKLKCRFPNEPEYIQAVEEVLSTIEDVYNEHPEFERYNLIDKLTDEWKRIPPLYGPIALLCCTR